MAFVVEDGTGLANATSYLSVADADAYFADRNNPAAWRNAEDAKATGTMVLANQPTDGDTFTIGLKVYTLEDTLTDVDGNIQIGATLAETQANIVAAINLTGTPGTQYAASMTENTDVDASEFSSNEMVLTAITGGTAGNAIATTSTFTDLDNKFKAATLSGGYNTKEQALIMATQYLDNAYHLRWIGEKATADQALDWPRSYAYDGDDYLLASNAVPVKVTYATCEAALRHLTTSGGLMPDWTENGTLKRKKSKLGPLETDKEWLGGYSPGTPTGKYAVVEAHLKGLISSASQPPLYRC